MKITWLMSALAAGLMAGGALQAQPGKKAAEEVFTDPDKAGPDFKLQGEYEGDAGGAKLGAQAVARGEGKFLVSFLTGGLPGAGWDGKTKVPVPAKVNPQAATPVLLARFDANGWSGNIVAGETLTGKTPAGKEFTLHKVVRHSPDEGAKAAAGALVLFDGTNTNQLQKAQIVEGNLLKWGALSKQSFGDLKGHVEFRLPFKPTATGQERGNSGIKLQGRYEIQILDSFGLKGDKNECGAVYTQTAPSVNMCYPPLSWQTYDFDFKAARYDAAGKKTANVVVSLVHNGVPVLDHVVIPAKTGASKAEGPNPAPLEFQDHGNPVVFRNIWVVEPAGTP